MDLTNEQWAILEPLIPEPVSRPDGKGRPWRENREVLDGILWVLKTGARWQDLPERYPPHTRRATGVSRPGSEAVSWKTFLRP